MIDSTREPDLVRLLADLEGRLYAQERLSGAAGGSSTVTGPVHITVKNTSGGALTAGTAVYATGSVGASGAVEVGVCDNADAATMPALGLLDGDLANNGEGSATILGIIDQIDTSSWAINDELWVNGSGALTNVRPSSGLIQKIGRVVRVNASTGEVLVLGAGRTNDVPFPLFVDDANQRVGIGTASPSTILEVADSNPATLTLKGTDSIVTAGTEVQAIDFYQSDASGGAGVSARIVGVGNNSSGAQNLTFHTGQAGLSTVAERMRIDSNGKVGIGTTSPAANLQVASENRAFSVIDSGTSNYAEAAFTALGGDGPAYGRLSGYDIQLQTGTTRGGLSTAMHLDNDGKVGIGTTTPGEALDVDGNVMISADQSYYINSVTSGVGRLRLHWAQSTGHAYVDYKDDLNFRANGTGGAVTFKSNGKVGIGTTSPGAPLHVVGNVYNSGVIESDGTYTNTTGASANMHVSSGGFFYRSTVSSIKYKTDVETMGDSYADAILGLRPVWYRSLCEHDPDSWGYWGFIAEEVDQIDPRLVSYTVPEDYEWQYGDDGQKLEPTAEDLTVPDAVQYDRFVPHLVNLVKRQRDELVELRARIEALEN
jgi:uncharacterized protein YigE (DUF2233 family)